MNMELEKYSIKNVLQFVYAKWNTKPYLYIKNGKYYSFKTFGELVENSIYLARALVNKGLKDKNIMLYGENSFEWMYSDLAIMGFVGTSVGADKQWNASTICNELERCQISAIIYSNKNNQGIEKIKKLYPNLIYISMQDDLVNLIEIGKEIQEKEDKLFDIEEMNEDRCSKIFFSSGTTALPKAIMQSQKNLLLGYNEFYKRIPLNEHDKDYLFLPLHHAYAELNFLYSLISGMSIYLCSDISNLFEDIKLINPTLISVVPKILKKIYESTNGNKNMLCNFFGQNMKYLVNAGAPLPIEIKELYSNLGINIINFYGSSELLLASGGTSIDESIGKIYDNVDIKILSSNEDEYGEILIKSNSLFLGYYDDERLTKKVVDEQGYYHTNDIGYIKNNNLYYVKRKDRIIVGENGEKINPEEIENLIKKYNNFKKVLVYLKDNNIRALLYSDNLDNCDEIINEVNEQLPNFKKIKEYNLLKTSALNFKGN